MKTLILVAALATWNYDGFVSDPPADHSPMIHDPEIDFQNSQTDAAPAVPPKPLSRVSEAKPPASPAAPTGIAFKPRAIVPFGGTWRLADDSGQLWEHDDPAWLVRWVNDRNATLRKRKGLPGSQAR